MPRNNSFSRKNNTTVICWSQVSKASKVQYLISQKASKSSQTLKCSFCNLLEVMQPRLIKTEEYFPTVGCPLFHMPSTKPTLQLCWLLLPQTRKRESRASGQHAQRPPACRSTCEIIPPYTKA